MTIAQSKVGYNEVNKNVGNGEDVSVLGDLPYKSWSIVFRPENIGFLVMPFDNAFALKWWLPGYLLIISAYFFVLMIFPKKRLLATLLSSAFLFSPFFQWWYLPDTLGVVSGALFGIIVLLKILRSKKKIYSIAWSILLAYIATCFIFFFYPPFQISCGLIAVAFLVGYLITHREVFKKPGVKLNILFAITAAILSVLIVVVFMLQHQSTIHAIENTVYPGTRVTKSADGGNLYYFLSSNISPVLEIGDRYQAYDKNTSKSELSNFVVITPFLLLPAFYMLYVDKKKMKLKYSYALIAVIIVFILFLAWSFIPGLSILGKVTLLDKVPVKRLLIGIGLANFVLLVLLIDLYKRSRVIFSNSQIIIYCLLIVIFYLLLDMHWLVKTPGFLGIKTAVLLSLPFAVIAFLYLKKWYLWGSAALLGFSLLSIIWVNPLYVGTDAVTKTPISQAIQKFNKENPKTWIGDDNYLENFPLANGARSLSATYYYPQLSLWREIDPKGAQSDVYNRYAHVNFAFDRDANKTIKPTFYKRGEDLFYVIIEPCDPFLKNNNVGYLMTAKKFNTGEARCATLKTTVTYPNKTFYIYKLSFNP